MLEQRYLDLLDRCSNHLDELGQIHGWAGVGGTYIRNDLRELENWRNRLDRVPNSSRTRSGDRIDGGMVDDIVKAYRRLGGKSSHLQLYSEVRKVRREAGRSIPANLESWIRQTLQAHCAAAKQYRGRSDLFVRYGQGRWGLKVLV